MFLLFFYSQMSKKCINKMKKCLNMGVNEEKEGYIIVRYPSLLNGILGGGNITLLCHHPKDLMNYI